MSGRGGKGKVNHERWLVSYADFITLLFAFFVVLYAFAKADQKKRVEVTAAIDAAFRSLGIFGEVSHHPGKSTGQASAEEPAVPMNIVMGEEVMSPARVRDDLDRIRRELEQRLSNQVAQHTVAIEMGRDGLIISLREAGFFASGSAEPRPETVPTLRQIAASLAGSPYNMRIEGHTDNVPIHTAQFDSNWELSSARATHIARLFLNLKALPPNRISAAGFAEFHPVASNATAEGRAENRRVDLVVMPQTRTNLAAPGPGQPGSVQPGPVQQGPVQQADWRRIGDN
jgi:chemotaxis protein MotB